MIMSKAPTKKRVLTEVVAVCLVLGLGLVFEPYIEGVTFRTTIRAMIVAMLVGLAVFVWRYSRQPWRGSAGGRALMRVRIS